jgi:hypothetical protein
MDHRKYVIFEYDVFQIETVSVEIKNIEEQMESDTITFENH